MHTVIVVAGALALLCSCLLFGYAWGGGSKGLGTGAYAFIGLWLVGAAINLWIGVSRAGYTVAQEVPIFLGVFGAPALIAALIAWKAA